MSIDQGFGTGFHDEDHRDLDDRPDTTDRADDGPDVTPVPRSSGQARSRPSSARRESARRQRALVRKAAERYRDVSALDESDRAVLAAIAGCEGADLLDLTVALVVPSRSAATGHYQDLVDVADADPLEAGVLAAQLASDKPRFKAAWSLAAALNVTDTATPPSVAPAKAGLALAKAAQSMDEDTRTRLERVKTQTC